MEKVSVLISIIVAATALNFISAIYFSKGETLDR
jgi:hypothetical protein